MDKKNHEKNSGCINAYLQNNFRTPSKEEKQGAFDYLKSLDLERSELIRLGQYWASCVNERIKKCSKNHNIKRY